MEAMLKEPICSEKLMKFERNYKAQESIGKADKTTTFEYAWCLVRSKYRDDWQKGLVLLQELYKCGDKQEQRDYIFYMAIANYKLKEYEQAIKLCDGIIYVEPQNHQAKELKEIIKKAMKKDGLTGMAVLGGAGVVLGVGVAALATIGILARRK